MIKKRSSVIFVLGVCLCFWINVVQGQRLTGPVKGLKSKTTEQMKTEGTKKSIAETTGQTMIETEKSTTTVLIPGTTGQTEIGDEIMGKVDGKTKVILKKVWEKQFDEPVSDIVFDEEEVTVKEAKARGWKQFENRKDNEKVKVSYPKLEFVADEINFRKEETRIKEVKILDKTGRISKKIVFDKSKGDYLVTLQNKKYFLVAHGTNFGGSLYNDKGDLIWDKYSSGPTPVAVSDEGYVVAQYRDEYATGDTIFYDAKGNELGQIKDPYSEKGIANWSNVSFIDNDYAVLVFHLQNKTTVVLATKEGRELWTKEFEGELFMENEFTGKANLGLLGVNWDHGNDLVYVVFIDWLGNTKWKLPIEVKGIIRIEESKENRKIYICSSIGYVWCIDIDNGKLLWSHKENWATRIANPNKPRLYEIKLSDNYLIVIKQNLNRGSIGWHGSEVIIFDSETGKLLNRTERLGKQINLNQSKGKINLIDMKSKKIEAFIQEGGEQ